MIGLGPTRPKLSQNGKECNQTVGASDLDDILLNALGALLGWCVWRLGHALRQKGR